ncbi:MAG: glycogen synthase GlgA [Candidatus Aminicenantes bacterium]|nr:glycogen synthase GlgA [Candidatus Aminicenantes bacterium]
MKVSFLASEAIPYCKTGGLGDVVGSLPYSLTSLGLEICLFLPFYLDIQQKNLPLHKIAELNGRWQGKEIKVPLWESKLSPFRVVFIQNDAYYAREGLYGTPLGDHPDNAERFSFYCLFSLEAMKTIGFKPDIIHAHDWQAACSLAYLRYLYKEDHFFKSTRTLFTIHNLAYQGLFPPEVIEKVGLPAQVFHWKEMEFYGQVNFLKAGLIYSDAISTVSPTYSREIQQPEYGYGLDGVLRERSSVLFGILNGIDQSIWDPEKDPLLPFHFNSQDLSGKRKCKEELLRYFKLPTDLIEKPLAGIVSRLANQKGFDLLIESLESLFSLGLRLVILGQGEKKYQDLLLDLQKEKRNFLRVKIAFDESLAHLIIAGCDFFFIPSRFEPCGLTQMYSLRYGTIPIVRAVGGLEDTVVEFDPLTLRGNGFKFKEYSTQALIEATKRALAVYSQPNLWSSLIKQAMAADFSWEKTAQEYIDLYRRIQKF